MIALSRKLSKEHKYDAAEYKAVLEEILSLSADLKSERIYALPSARFYSYKFKLEQAREPYEALIGDPHSLRCGDEFINYGRGGFLTPCSSLRKRIGILKPTSTKRQNFLKFAMMGSMRFKF